MVTEILRPIYSEAGSNSMYYPEDIRTGEEYRLVNEEIADDSATYIEENATISGSTLGFDSDILQNNYSKITACRLVCRVQGDPESSVGSIRLEYATSDIGSPDLEVITQSIITTDPAEWETIYIDVDIDLIKMAIENNIDFENSSTPYPLIIRLHAQSSAEATSKSTVSMKYTQVYFEITYSDGEEEPTTETIYLKENGAWVSTSCNIYQKQNGLWILMDSTVFENGDRYIFQNIT
jgi:hypothetical protein